MSQIQLWSEQDPVLRTLLPISTLHIDAFQVVCLSSCSHADAALQVSPVRLSVCPVQAPDSTTKTCEKTNIGHSN